MTDTAASLRDLEDVCNEAKQSANRDAQAGAAAARDRRVREAIASRLDPAQLHALVAAMRQAAESGEHRYLALRFPAGTCTDGGRKINSAQPDWGATLRGEAADMYRFWAETLQPLGFKAGAQVLDFPGGKPGDIGLTFTWG
jgi:hypothetical protein